MKAREVREPKQGSVVKMRLGSGQAVSARTCGLVGEVPRRRGRFSFSAVVENNDPVYVVNRF